MADFLPLLIELGTEELPPKALPELAQAFHDGVLKGLAARRIEVREGTGELPAGPLYSPRRLAVYLPAVATQQPVQHSEVPGPYTNIGLDAEGKPTPALLGFAQKNGIEWEKLDRVTDAKGMRFVARSSRPGAATAELLAEITAEALKALPVPKPMRWGDRDISFVRPAHWLVILLGRDVAPGEVLGLKSDRMSRGHRFHHAKGVWLNEAGEYVQALREAKVLVDPRERRQRIRAEIAAAAKEAGGQARVPEALLEEVNCLVEWPKAIVCSFGREFLRVPQEALVLTMETNQKFFPVLDAEGKLSEKFIGIANIESKDPAEVRKGYERVIRPRFADAAFFCDEDLKQGLPAMAQGLRTVTYQQKLGTLDDKCQRVATLARELASPAGVAPADADRAASLAKADLLSRLVGEFPELQGTAGRYYAVAAGELPTVAAAIDEAYMPRFAGDAIAPSPLGRVLAIAERLDTLAGGFAAGLKPTGNKDPFALRRNALGLARTLIEGGLDLDLLPWIDRAIGLVRKDVERIGADAGTGGKPTPEDMFSGSHLQEFIIDRLRGYYAEQGVPATQFDAVAEVRPGSLVDFDKRLKAIAEFARLREASSLAAANKRIRNILRKVETPIPAQVDPRKLAEPAEQALNAALAAALADTDPLLAQRDYVATLKRLAALQLPVDNFFERTLVMAEDPAVRDNRLALLKLIADRFAAVAAVEQLSAG
ncbi:MAG: glycine--tRNA ligase subunit beta [Arenimonas sp. SCN 70-307]|uniref:glycine--tRNA ligase subunit beta n=1 Tax=Arenimonas sp. SCN 70-307 TaxID=1660089 RepID=UPI00086ABB5C|nr:glycine--tRNA ligase subunit beta [Arenimonas sp. SCN 70-307]ODS63588.1 MAG: glycine--tRNA ligase subunit beta [Arenimonas sp. SCN 70-307]